jgi:hypothetical protein
MPGSFSVRGRQYTGTGTGTLCPERGTSQSVRLQIYNNNNNITIIILNWTPTGIASQTIYNAGFRISKNPHKSAFASFQNKIKEDVVTVK